MPCSQHPPQTFPSPLHLASQMLTRGTSRTKRVSELLTDGSENRQADCSVRWQEAAHTHWFTLCLPPRRTLARPLLTYRSPLSLPPTAAPGFRMRAGSGGRHAVWRALPTRHYPTGT